CAPPFVVSCCPARRDVPPFPTRRSSDLAAGLDEQGAGPVPPPAQRRGARGQPPFPPRDGDPHRAGAGNPAAHRGRPQQRGDRRRSEEHTSELQSRENLVCRLLPEKKKMP